MIDVFEKEQTMMAETTPSTSIASHFAMLSDPRQAMNQEHLLLDSLVIAICGVIAGGMTG